MVLKRAGGSCKVRVGEEGDECGWLESFVVGTQVPVVWPLRLSRATEKDKDDQSARPHSEGRNQFWCLRAGV